MRLASFDARRAETPKSQRTTRPVSVMSRFAATLPLCGLVQELSKKFLTFKVTVYHGRTVKESKSNETFAHDDDRKTFFDDIVLRRFHLSKCG